MPELTEDRVEDLFAELRADVVAGIRPPGTDVVRRTVRRRRNTASTAAVLAVVVIAGSTFAGWGPGLVDDRMPASPAGQQKPRPLGDRAEQALPPQPGVGDEQLMITRQVMYLATGPSDYEDVPFAYLEGVTPNSAPAGTYAIDVSCGGQGSARVTVVSVPPRSGAGGRRPDYSRAEAAGTAAITCSADPRSSRLTVSQATDGYLRVDVNANSAEAGTAAVAFMVTARDTGVGRNVRRAYEALAAANPQVPTDTWLVQYDPPGTMAIADSSAGGRTAQVVCVGTGVVTVVMVDDDHVETPIRNPITCDMTARVHTIAVPPAKAVMYIKAKMDAVALERSGYALVFPRFSG